MLDEIDPAFLWFFFLLKEARDRDQDPTWVGLVTDLLKFNNRRFFIPFFLRVNIYDFFGGWDYYLMEELHLFVYFLFRILTRVNLFVAMNQLLL